MPCVSGLVINDVGYGLISIRQTTNFKWNFSTSGVKIDIFQKHQVNTITADALVPCVTRPSTAVVLTMYDKHIIFHEEGFQISGSSEWVAVDTIKTLNLNLSIQV